MNPMPDPVRLVDRLTMARADGSSKQWTASQKAQIGSKTVTITLHFDKHTTLTEATKLMKLSLEKVASLDVSQSGERVIHLKVIPQFELIQDRIESLQSQLLPKPVAYDFAFITTQVLSASPSTKGTHGKVVQDKFALKHGGKATEKAVRADTVTHLMQSLQTKLKRLQEKLEHDPGNSKLQEELAKTQSEMAKYSRQKRDATWGSTNSPRFAFKALGRKLAKEIMAPVACNLRMQTVADADGAVVSSITRSGALSDFSHGEVSLQELKDLHDLENWDKLSKTRQTQLTRLYLIQGTQTRTHSEVIQEIKIKALVGYSALTANDSRFDGYRFILQQLQGVNSITEAMKKIDPKTLDALTAIPLDRDKLDAIIEGRSRFLKQMALQDLQLHLKTNPTQKSSVLYSRTSVVDMQKPSKNEHGLVLDEKTQSLDMKALFDELEGSELLFDCEEAETAFIDEEGKIHLPKTCAAEGIKEAKLETVFFSICTQGLSGHTVNQGMQKAINDEALAKLEMRYPSSAALSGLKTSFEALSHNPNVDPNNTVLLTTLLVQEQGGYTGINCYGGKDRTGYAAAMVTHYHLKALDGLTDDSPVAKKWGHQLLGRSGVAAKIAEDNADHTVLKLTRKDLSLYNMDTLKGKMLRAAHAISGLFKAIAKSLKDFFGLDSLSVSKSSGQLYKPLHASRISQLSIVRKIKTLTKYIPF